MKTNNFLLLGAAILGMGIVACGDDSGTGGAGGESTTTTSASGSTSSTPASSGATNPTTTSASSGGDGGSGAGTSDGGAGGGTGGEGGEGGSGPPAIPELGTQLERMGRPAINTATNETFITLAGGSPGPTTNVIRSNSQDAYNEAVNGSEDAESFITTAALQLTVLDSLDGECGNQPFYGFMITEDDEGNPVDCSDLTTAPPGLCYGPLATALNNDVLWVKTDAETCGIYLGLEADFGNLVPNDDCGGRRPIDDVIRTTYSVVAGAGTFDPEGTTPTTIFTFDDEIDPPADLHPGEFPYLAAPYEE